MADVHSFKDDERGLTAVIEFLSAFTLFLMILTAFLSLAQLQMGSNDPALDRLDRAAILGVDRLTASEGWFVPLNDGAPDYNNATSEWHLEPMNQLDAGRLQAGIVSGKRLDFQRIAALSNVTEEGFSEGLGLGEKMSVFLTIRVEESGNTSREGLLIFQGGTPRTTSSSSSTAFRTFYQEGEKISVILEVHMNAKVTSKMILTEVMTRPSNSGPEWIEIHNPNQFAISLRGWSLNHTSGVTSTNFLFQDGVVPGNSTALFSGDPTTQKVGNASVVIDLGSVGFLGVGQVNAISDGSGVLRLRYTQLTHTTPSDIDVVEWGGNTGLIINVGYSIERQDSTRMSQGAWDVQDSPTPGIYVQ
ncbi:MAG: lamin tail domain-containing protein [archaeon]|nr:lamin tail domain-containing protein [archaeon]MDA0843028.1 lamin tail domain-containing protein [archaeon]